MSNIVEYILNLKDNLSPALDGATQHVKKLEGAFGGLKELALHTVEAMGVSFAVFKGFQTIEEGIEKVEEFHKAEASLTNTMKNMGTYSEESFEKIIKGAADLSQTVGYSKAQFVGLQAQLQLVGNIGEDEMNRLEKVSADYATKFGMDLETAGNTLAKAINNPEMARRLGQNLKIDPTVMEHIQNLAKNGKEAEARMELLSIAESKVGGAAKAAFNADPLAKFNKTIGSVKMEVGNLGMELLKSLTPDLEGMAAAMKETVFIAEDVKKWVVEHSGLFMALKDGAIAAGIAFGVFKTIEISQIAISKLMIFWEAIQLASINKLGDGYLTASTKMIAFSGIMETVEAAIAANPIGAVILAIGALTAGFMALTNNISAATEANDKFKKSILGLVQDAKTEGVKEVYEIADRFEQGIKGFDKTGKAIKYTIDEKNKLIKDAIGEQIKLVEEAHTVIKNGIPILDLGFAGQQQISQLQNYKSLLNNRGKNTTQKIDSAAAIAAPKTKAEGQKVVNIHIAINGGLVHEMKIMTTNISQGYGKIKEAVQDVLVGVINDSQIVASN